MNAIYQELKDRKHSFKIARRNYNHYAKEIKRTDLSESEMKNALEQFSFRESLFERFRNELVEWESAIEEIKNKG